MSSDSSAGLRPGGSPLQQVIEDRRGHGDAVVGGEVRRSQRLSQVDAVHHRLDDAAGDELIGPHGREVAGTDQAGRDGARFGDGLGKVSTIG